MKSNLYTKTRIVAEKIIEIVDELYDYHPLTVRQVFYQLVASNVVANVKSRYQSVSRLLTILRENGDVDWSAIEDRSRRFISSYTSRSVYEFLEEQIFLMLGTYQRNLVQDQPKHIEVWSEKDALVSIIERSVQPYRLNIVISRGQCSTSFLKDFVDRCTDLKKQGVIIYVGDFDPSGVIIPESIQKRLRDKFDTELDRVALNQEQIQQFSLPVNYEAIKKDDPNRKAFIARYGKTTVELDALLPDILISLIRQGIEKHLKMPLFGRQQAYAPLDNRLIDNFRRNFKNLLKSKS